MKLFLMILSFFLFDINVAYTMNNERLKLPGKYQKTRKSVCEKIKNLFDKKENESIRNEFKHLTDFDTIKNDLFGDMGGSNLLLTAIYIKPPLKKSESLIFIGGLKARPEKIGSLTIGIKIANRIIYWCEGEYVLMRNKEKDEPIALLYPENDQGQNIYYVKCSEELKNKIALLIQKWNCSLSFSQDNSALKFVLEMLETMGLKNNLLETETVKNFINHKPMFPCLIKDSQIIEEWSMHEHLDNRHNNYKNIGIFAEQNPKWLKAFHIGFGFKGEKGLNCPYHNEPLFPVPPEEY